MTPKKILRSTSVAITLCAMGTMVPVVTPADDSRIYIDVQETTEGSYKININMPEDPQGSQLFINGKPFTPSPAVVCGEGDQSMPPRGQADPHAKSPGRQGGALFLTQSPVGNKDTVPSVVHWLDPQNPDGAQTELNDQSESVLREISIACPGSGKLYIEGSAFLRNQAWMYDLGVSLSIKTTTSEVTSTHEYQVKDGEVITGVIAAEYDCAEGQSQVVTLLGKGDDFLASNYSLSIWYHSRESKPSKNQ